LTDEDIQVLQNQFIEIVAHSPHMFNHF